MPEISNGPNLSCEKQMLSEQAQIAFKKLEYDHLIGRLALRGTLWGAWAALFTIVLIVFAPIVTKKDIVDGWQLVSIVGLVVVAVVAYGAYVFNRALNVSARTPVTEVRLASPPPDAKP